jgi:ATP-dependent Clp protease ATP-binding subunit ClpC
MDISDNVKETMRESRVEAMRLNKTFIDAGELMLGMLDADPAVEGLLSQLGCNIAQLRTTLELAEQTQLNLPIVPEGAIPLTDRAEDIFKSSFAQAETSGSERLESGHLLLSLVRHHDNPVVAAFLHEGIAVADVEKKIGEMYK